MVVDYSKAFFPVLAVVLILRSFVAEPLRFGRLFLAGIMPGIYLGLALVATWWLRVRKEDVMVPPRRARSSGSTSRTASVKSTLV